MADSVRTALVSGGFGHGSVARVALLLVGLLVEFVQLGVVTSVLEVSVFEEFDSFGFELPGGPAILFSLHEFGVMLSVGCVPVINTNGEMSSTNVVSCERSQVSVDILALIKGILVVLHHVGGKGSGISTDENGISNELLLVSDALSWVASRFVKGILKAGLVISKTTALVSSHIKVGFQSRPCRLFRIGRALGSSSDGGAGNLAELSRVLA